MSVFHLLLLQNDIFVGFRILESHSLFSGVYGPYSIVLQLLMLQKKNPMLIHAFDSVCSMFFQTASLWGSLSLVFRNFSGICLDYTFLKLILPGIQWAFLFWRPASFFCSVKFPSFISKHPPLSCSLFLRPIICIRDLLTSAQVMLLLLDQGSH